MGLGFLIKKATKVLKGHYLMQGKDDQAEELDNFSTLLSYFWTTMFSDAEYANIKARQLDLRRPKHLPIEEDVKRLRDYTMKKITELVDPHCFFTSSEFKSLRDLLVCRLTLFNARRGGEPSRLLMQEWNDAENGEWIDDTTVQSTNDPIEKQLIGKFKIAFQSGKNLNQLVPLLIPNDCLDGIRKLANTETRKNAGVNEKNIFLFPNTKHSEKHIKGWHAVHSVCIEAGLSNHINATSMRHRAATAYAALDVPDAERQIFYKHMGHSEDINRNVYQCPMAVQEVTKVGRFLDRLDIGENNQSGSSTSASAQLQNTSTVSSGDGKQRKGFKKQTENKTLPKDSHCSKDSYPDNHANSEDNTGLESHDMSKPQGIVSTLKKIGERFSWPEEDTRRVREYFSVWVEDTSTFDRKGALPGKTIIVKFLTKYPKILGHMDMNKRVSLMRTKLFNERNKSRSSVTKHLSPLWR